MRKLLKQPWFVAALALTAIVLCTLSLREQLGGGGFSGPVATTDIESTNDDGSGEESTAPAIDGSPRSIAAVLAALEFPTTIPDPFSRRGINVVAGEPVPEAAPVLPDEKDTILLTAVWQQGGDHLALVNNRIVRAGEKVGRITIDEITVDGIWVSHWKGRNFVTFGSEFTLLTPAGSEPAPAPAPSLALHET
jgi:hypothetical protein